MMIDEQLVAGILGIVIVLMFPLLVYLLIANATRDFVNVVCKQEGSDKHVSRISNQFPEE